MKKTALMITLLAALTVMTGLTGCGKENPSSDSSAEVSASISESVSESESSSESSSGVSSEETSEEDSAAMKEAARAALEQVLSDHILPDGSDFSYDESFGALSDNRFAIFDADGDGKDELILSITTAPSVGMVEMIYGYDAENGTFSAELTEFPAITYLENGLLKAGWSHNQGLANPDTWPYTLYRYNAEKDSYDLVAGVDSWDKSLYPKDFDGNPFPDDIDEKGDGIVYLVEKDGSTDTLSKENFDAWYKEETGNAEEVSVPYEALTEENISAIQ